MKKHFYAGVFFISTLFLTGCYSVFNGGTGGQIVDAESTANPKEGIAYVDIYAYTSSSARNKDFKNWQEGTVFSPSNTYYGHTTTNANGNFTLSNLVWKETNPDFGKDADFTTIYLLYYHENYGLIKDQTLITSDSTSDTVYAELTSIRKTTALNITVNDVSNSAQTANPVLVTVSVPQSTDTLTAKPTVYKQVITGTGTINISYPRWKNSEDKENNIEITPQVSITYSQSSDEITWKACANADNEAKNYAFLEDGFTVIKTVRNSSYNINLYGKPVKIAFPAVSGTYGDTSDASNDGVVIKMRSKASDGTFSIDCGETTTTAQTIGTSATQTHGNFTGLGNGFFWTDTTYTEKFSTIDVQFYDANGERGTPQTLRSDTASYNFTL